MAFEETKCRSWDASNPAICRDGFPTSAACFGARCWSCGSHAAERKLPACMDENISARFLDDRGMPRYNRNL